MGQPVITLLKTTQDIPSTRLGIRAHDLGRFPADVLARKVSDAGLDCVQLALGKAIEGVELAPGFIDEAFASRIGAAFAAYQVGVEVLGCYINPIHPDANERALLMLLFKDHLRHARAFGCNIVALESGSLNADYSPHPGNADEEAFQCLLGTLRELVDEAERFGVVVGIEAVTSHVISTPERMRRLLDEISSPHLQVVFDPVNLLTSENCGDHRGIMRRSFELFGDRIAVVHAKDFRLEEERLVFCPPGTGSLDFEFLLSWLPVHRPGIAVLMEETPVECISSCSGFLKNPTGLSVS